MSAGQAESIYLGSSGVRVSPLGVGTNAWRDDPAERESLLATFEEATGLGVSLFDTAEIYGAGSSERALGRCIQASSRKPVVTTKFFPFPWRLGKRALAGALRSSLERLQVPRADLYLVHFPAPPVSIETWMRALADANQSGLALSVGVSNYTTAQLRRAHAALAAHGIPLAANQVEFSLLKRDAETSGLLAACKELGVALIAYRPLALGYLSGKYSPENPPGGWRGLVFSREYARRARPVVEQLRKIAGRRARTLSQVALNWLICKGALPIAGATSPDHLRENAGAMGWRLSEEEMAALDGAAVAAPV